MQEILDTMNGYSLRISLPFLPPMSVPRPTGATACEVLLYAYGRREEIMHSRPPPLSLSLAECVAQFLVPSECLVVASPTAIATVSLGPAELSVLHTCGSSKREGEFTGIAACRETVMLPCGLGISEYCHELRFLDDFDGVGHSDVALCVDATPDGLYMATGGRDAAVVFWSRDHGPLKYMVGHTDWVRFVRFHYQGRLQRLLLLSASDDGSVAVWDPLRGGRALVADFDGKSIRCFDVARDESLVAVTFDASSILLFRLCGGEEGTEDRRTTSGSTSSDVQLVAVGSIREPHRGTMTTVRFTPNAQWILSASEDETIAISSVEHKAVMWKCAALVTKRRCISFMNTISSIAVLAAPPSSSVIMIAACSSDGDVLFWVVDPRDGRAKYERKLQLQIGSLIGIDVVRWSLLSPDS